MTLDHCSETDRPTADVITVPDREPTIQQPGETTRDGGGPGDQQDEPKTGKTVPRGE